MAPLQPDAGRLGAESGRRQSRMRPARRSLLEFRSIGGPIAGQPRVRAGSAGLLLGRTLAVGRRPADALETFGRRRRGVRLAAERRLGAGGTLAAERPAQASR